MEIISTSIKQIEVAANAAMDISTKLKISLIKITSFELPSNSTIRSIKKSRITNKIKSKKISSKILTTIYLNAPTMPVNSINYLFTVSDLVDNNYTVYHGFNSTVDVSVFDEFKKEVEVGVDVSDPNRVTVNLARLNVSGTWQIKIEK